MIIKRVSTLTGKHHVREIDCTEGQYELWLDGAMVQNAIPNLSADDREFILSGITPEEWEQAFGKED